MKDMKIQVKSREEFIAEGIISSDDLADFAKYHGKIYDANILEKGLFVGDYMMLDEYGNETGIFLQKEVK